MIMADLIIRGIELPKEPTPLTLYPDGHWNDYTDGSNGKFFLFPEEYGKLIDADALMNNIGDVPYKGAVRRVLLSAPAIVPVERGSNK